MNSHSRHNSERPLIQSLQNAWIKSIVKLQRSPDRKRAGLFLVEGPHLLEEAVRTGWALEAILHSETVQLDRYEWMNMVPDFVALQPVTESILQRIASTESTQGLVGIARVQSTSHAAGKPSLGLALESIQDPGNLGTLIRASVASGCSGLFVGAGSVDIYSPKVLRSSAGQWFRMPPQQVDLPSWLRDRKEQGVQVLAAAADGKSFWDHRLNVPTIFVLGNEGAGLSQDVLNLSNDVIAIPMNAEVESLNVAMTGTLLLYEAMRQRCTSSRTT